MDTQTTQLIEKLATKLGTTAGHLWGVLIQQARVEAFLTLTGLVLLTISSIILVFVHLRFLKPRWDHEPYYNYSESSGYVMGILAALLGIFWIVMICFGFQAIINGLFNPEYWALNEILSSLK